MAPTYKLTYFSIKGLAEPIRFLLSYGGIEFEDVRIEHENWHKFKVNMPFGQVPILEVNGKKINQSVAICRYFGKQMKLVGANDWEDLEIDSIGDTVNDFRDKIAGNYYETDVKLKESRKPAVYNEVVPYYLGRFDEIAKANKGHLAIGKFTWPDFYFVALLDYLNFMAGKDLIAEYPNLQEVQKNVLSIPSVKEWVERRPKSEF